MKKQNMEICVTCKLCGEDHYILVYREDYAEYAFSPNRRHIQDIFPYLEDYERELLISGICNDCWAEMFSLYDEEGFDECFEFEDELEEPLTEEERKEIHDLVIKDLTAPTLD